VNLVLYGLVGPLAVTLMESFSIRRTVMASLGLVASGGALTTIMRGPWQLVLFWCGLVGLRPGTTAMVLGATVVQRWFAARRGFVLGMLTAQHGHRPAPLPSPARLAGREPPGAASFTVAGALVCVIPLVFLAMREQPADLDLLPYGASPGDQAPATPRTNPLANASARYAAPPASATSGSGPADRLASIVSYPLTWSLSANRRADQPRPLHFNLELDSDVAWV